MNAERWEAVKRIFEAALQRAPSERASFLQEACEGDSELREEVESLLEAHAGEGPVDRLMEDMQSVFHRRHSADALLGRQIGPYELVEELGQGGMGRVFRARRTDGQFEHEVALKLLGVGLPSPEARDRFLAERQILATLDHPNIARLLGGGVTDEGQPYFALEIVDGKPIDAYCARRDCSARERLELFLAVCEAVQYAHGKLIIHRDLKPANILVTEEGTVKLLDFGIAKLLDPEASFRHRMPRTRAGLLPMTPSYASPEQVRGDSISTASDVYQLGVVLYELLAGTRPYDVTGRPPGEVERVICEEQPARPSATAAGRTGEDRAGRLRALRPGVLQGDLDTIVMKALRKEAARRYESVEQLAGDIRRHLDGRPVSAHPDRWTYRAGKFLRRNRWEAGAVAVLVALLVVYALTITWHSQRTQAALDRAEREAETAEQVTGFLTSLFERANPYAATTATGAFSDTLTTQDLLERGSERVRQELSDQPEVQARIMHTLGSIYRQLGQYDRGASLLEEALALQREHLPPHHLDRAESLHELARLLRHKGELDRPERLYQEALAIQRAGQGDQHPEIAKNLSELGIIAAREGAYDRADSLFREALAMHESTQGPSHPDVARGHVLLGLLRVLQEEYVEAEELYRRAVATYQEHFGRQHPDVAGSLDRLGQALVMQGRLEEAEPLLREAMSVRDRMFQTVHPDRAVSLNNMGRLLRKQGRYAEADELLQEAQAIYQEMYGPENMDAATTLSERAKVYQAKGEYPVAESLYREAVTMQQALHGTDNRYTQQYLRELADLYEAWGRADKTDSLQALFAEDDGER